MHPTEIIEMMIVSAVVIIFIVAAYFLKDKWRKVAFILTLGVVAAYSIIYFVRPFVIDARVGQKVEQVEAYLIQNHSSEEWTITTVPHREPGYKHLNPYYIGVVFAGEPDKTYHYWVESDEEIYQVGYSDQTK